MKDHKKKKSYSKYVKSVLKKPLSDKSKNIIDESYKIVLYEIERDCSPEEIINAFVDAISKENYEICSGIIKALKHHNKNKHEE